MKTNYNKLIKGIFVFLLYILVPYILDMFLPSITHSNSFELLYRFMFMFVLLVFYTFVYKDDLKEDIKNFMNNKKRILLKSLMYFGILLFGNILISAIIKAVYPNFTYVSSGIIDTLLNENALLMIFYIFIISLFTEQIVFRKVFRDIIRNKYFFIIFSGLVYGIFQIGYTFASINDVLALIPFTFVGILFSYSYYKTENILTPCFVYLFYDLFYLLLIVFGG